jgi:hypothetical protein
MAQEHLNTLLEGAGLDATDVAAILALPADAADFNPADYTGKIKTTFETSIKNDASFWESLNTENVNAEFKKKIEAEQFGRTSNIGRQKILKGLGYTDADTADFSDEEKKDLSLFVTKLADKFATSKATDKEVQAQLIEARKNYEELQASVPERETALKASIETNYNNEKLDFIILGELSAIEGLKAPAVYLAANIAATLKAEFAFNIEGFKANPMQKEKPTLQVVEGTKVLTLRDLIVKKLTTDGLIGEVKKADPKKGAVTVDVDPDGKGTLGISSHILDKAKANIPA